MSTIDRFDPQLLALTDPAFGIRIDPECIGQARNTVMEFYKSSALPEAKPSKVIKIANSNGNGDISLRVFVPSQEVRTRPAILEIHGGGFIIGEAAISDTQNYLMAREHEAVVVSVDYRLAPECPFPGPLEDCYRALAWLFDNATELGINVDRVVLFGNSAGGGLAAALAQLVRDRNELFVAAQFLIYPMLDCRTGTHQDPYQNPYSGEFAWTRESNEFGWTSMRGSGLIDELHIGYFSPAMSKNLTNLPPTFIAVGTLDLFVDENIDYAARLIRAGVHTELHVYPGAPHGFDLISNTDVANRFRNALSGALKRVLNPSE